MKPLFTWVIDSPEDVLGLVVIALALLAVLTLVLTLLLKRKDIKLSKKGVEITDDEAEEHLPVCPVDIQEEHTEILRRLEETTIELKENVKLLTEIVASQGDDLRALFRITRPALQAIDTALDQAKIHLKNDTDEAIKYIETAQELFDKHLMSKVGE